MSGSKHKIAVISDTHSLLRSEIKEKLMEYELILHAGDISSQETADEMWIKVIGLKKYQLLEN